ncbi:hypothetical protein [Microterricola pindariensis]|uniref:Transporter n=1 Tax=Microterricola pindariensis TaxID=478010 RepID=A0ABX5AS96_9MICO|nr:hypothetical protein [Microterricola pindariensis]PPL14150.1 hypothetical protein GY24_17020 [Microterricola pindariensis]
MTNNTEPQRTDDAAEMLAVIAAQQRRVDRMMLRPIPWMLGLWGVAWLVGFTLLWSAYEGGNPWFRIPMSVAAPIFGILIAGAIVASIIIGIRLGRGVKGVSTFAGAVYGVSWSLCGMAFAALGMGLIANGLSSELASIYFPSGFALMCGTLYLAGAALWRQVSMLVLGIIMLVVGAIAPFFGAPTNNIVMAVFGGGALLIAAIIFAVRLRQGR